MVVPTQRVSKNVFRFNRDFLSSYYKAGDPFSSLLARSTYLTKYCRDNETWTDTIRRVVEANISLTTFIDEKEAELLFHLFWTGQALPPGRGLWTGGVEGIPADARYNCFAKETKFWANGKLVAFEDVVGQTVEVQCKDGCWRSAEVKSFGIQKLQKIVMRAPSRSHFALEFTATPNHRWLTSRGEVTDLCVGDRVTVSPTPVDKNSQIYKDGFTHGFVFGDGTKETLREGVFKVRLCGEKDRQFESILKSSHMFSSMCTPPSYNGDPVLFFKANWNMKALPNEDEMGFAWQQGFLDGWLAADGSLRSDGRGGNRLASINAEALVWVTERAPLLGYCVTGYSIDPSTKTNFGPRSAPLGVLTLTREPVEYTVREIIDEGREEEVFCVTEPVTGTFTLEGGVVTGNCWYTTLYDVDDWCWTANQLMLGGGVGVGLNSLQSFPIVTRSDARFLVWCDQRHPNFAEVMPNSAQLNQALPALASTQPIFVVPDSREGWVEALRKALTAAFEGQDLVIDVSQIRPRGMPIRTFGGIACGPGPLVHLLRNAWMLVRAAQGRRLNSVEALDITNFIGLCIKSGNVRRSALITLGDAQDQAFRDAKKDFEKVASHRHTSNNSIVFRSWEQINTFDWKSLVEDNAIYGEPGILNLPLVWKTDPGARGVNPCGEQALHDREACNLAEVFPAKFEENTNPELAFRLVTRYCLRQRLTPLLDSRSQNVGENNMRVGVGLGGLCDFAWTGPQLERWYKHCRVEADRYADELGVKRPITVTTVKPSGTISLLNGSSPGLHAPFSEYYMRRTRIAKNDPMAEAMMEAGVPYEDDIYDKSGHTFVFAFPMKAAHTNMTVQSETIRDQFNRQAKVQTHWADNAVSATLSFAEEEKEELASCLKEFVPQLKSTSCLPKAHGYAQAPYEPINKSTFETMYGKINHTHPLLRGGNIEVEECAGGACPIR